MEKARFAAGCFWGVEDAFRAVPGVLNATVGYAGGAAANPTYQLVCSGNSGHAETVEVEYDPAKVSYDALLDTFFQSHDPTQMNRQGPDVGTQYRSAIFPVDDAQAAIAEAAIARWNASGKFPRPLATKVEPAAAFWKAEDYHQQYFAKQGRSHH